MDPDRANAIAQDVERGVNLLKSCIDTDEFRQFKEYVAEREDRSCEDLMKYTAIEMLMGM